MGYIPPSQRDTAWYLFYELFMVRVNPTKIRSIEEIKLYGTPTTGNEDYDREMNKSEDVVMLSIAQMEDIYRQGYPVKVVNYADTEKIYEYIAKHLVAMRNMTHGSENFNANTDTLKELIRLDQFAGAIFEHARHGMKQDVPQSSLIARMRGGRFSALGRNRQREASGPTVQGKGSGSLRDYSTGADAQTGREQPTDAPEAPTQFPEDPNLPKRTSLERLFEDQMRNATQWGGN